MEGMEDLSWIFDMEISQIQLQDEMEDQNEIEIRGKGKQAKENQDTVPDIQNVASSDECVELFFVFLFLFFCSDNWFLWRYFRQVNVEESTLMVPADQNEPVTETQMNQGPKGGADMDPRKLRRCIYIYTDICLYPFFTLFLISIYITPFFVEYMYVECRLRGSLLRELVFGSACMLWKLREK